MQGKICLITGATSGIGKVTARAIAERGATLVIVGRNENKGMETVREIQTVTKNKNISFILADLSSQTQIRRLVENFKSQYSKLDVLVNNAGAVFLKRRLSEDNIEMTFATNHLSGFLLTNLLLSALKKADSSRIISVSSATHKQAHLDEDDWQNAKKYSGMEAYHRSKLANLLFTYELNRRLAGTNVTVNAVKPGFTKSSLGRNNGSSPLIFVLRVATALFAQTAEEGARASIYLATSPQVENISGKYFYREAEIESSKDSYNREIQKRLWILSENLTKLND